MNNNSIMNNETMDPQLGPIFEGVSNDLTNRNPLRSCRRMHVDSNIGATEPGQYSVLVVEGGGYFCQWYYYHTLDRRHMLIFRSPDGDGFSFSGREIDEVPTSFGMEQQNEVEPGLGLEWPQELPLDIDNNNNCRQ